MFKKFLRETYTVTKKCVLIENIENITKYSVFNYMIIWLRFTLNDADAIFKKTVAKASAAPASSPLKTGD